MEKTTTTNLFELATRKKFLFPYKGQITVYDLWDLSLKNLDAVFKALSAEKKQASEASLLATKSPEDEILEAKIAIVQHIFNVKTAEAAAAKQAVADRQKAQQIQAIIADKQNQKLLDMNIEDLQAMLDQLQK